VSKLKVDSSKGIDLFLTNGEPITNISDVQFVNSPGLKANNDAYEATNISMNNQ